MSLLETQQAGLSLVLGRGSNSIGERFEERLVQGRDALARGDAATRGRGPSRSTRSLARRGPSPTSQLYEPFAQGEAGRLEELRMVALEERIDADLALGRHAEHVVAELEGLVAQHAFRERLRGQLMLALYRAGRQAEALEAYQESFALARGRAGNRAQPSASARSRRAILQQSAGARRASRTERVAGRGRGGGNPRRSAPAATRGRGAGYRAEGRDGVVRRPRRLHRARPRAGSRAHPFASRTVLRRHVVRDRVGGRNGGEVRG